MIIRSLNGNDLYKSNKLTFKTALEKAVKKRVDLSHLDARRRNLNHACLDGIKAPGACFWGVSFRSANLSGANFREADFRGADITDACLAESDCRGANFTSAFWRNTILRQCKMSGSVLSCPSFFSCAYDEVETLVGATYAHRGETYEKLREMPVTLRDGDGTMVMMKTALLVENRLYKAGNINAVLAKRLKNVAATINSLL